MRNNPNKTAQTAGNRFIFLNFFATNQFLKSFNTKISKKKLFQKSVLYVVCCDVPRFEILCYNNLFQPVNWY